MIDELMEALEDYRDADAELRRCRESDDGDGYGYLYDRYGVQLDRAKCRVGVAIERLIDARIRALVPGAIPTPEVTEK